MRNAIMITILSLVSAGLIETSFAAESLYGQFYKKDSIRFFTSIEKNNSSLSISQIESLKARLILHLTERKSLHFVESSLSESEIRIDVEINEYVWTEEDPIDMITSVPLALYDAATNEHYIRIMARFKVIDIAKQKILWEEIVKSTVSDATMTELEGFDRGINELAKNFIAKAFNKKNKG